jgi:hypothetical protein
MLNIEIFTLNYLRVSIALSMVATLRLSETSHLPTPILANHLMMALKIFNFIFIIILRYGRSSFAFRQQRQPAPFQAT